MTYVCPNIAVTRARPGVKLNDDLSGESGNTNFEDDNKFL
jgi:hypothetical protein